MSFNREDLQLAMRKRPKVKDLLFPGESCFCLKTYPLLLTVLSSSEMIFIVAREIQYYYHL